MNASEKPCPICKKENKDNATVCRHCGAPLEELSTKYLGVSESSAKAPALRLESSINVALIPEDGIGIHVAGEIKPLYISIAEELTIGRRKEATSTQELLNGGRKIITDTFLDLSDMHAGTLGVSRQHAKIKRTDSGYEVVDLTSRNGSWLNAERLIPNKAYPLSSGSQLRIGNMRLLIMYRTSKE